MMIHNLENEQNSISNGQNDNNTQTNLIKINIDDQTENENLPSENMNNPQESHEKTTEEVFFDKSSSLTQSRKNIHYQEKKEFKCPIEDCKKIFNDKGAFRKHQLTHGEKLYQCKVCSKKFLDNSKLRRHSLVHSGEKPFRCDICNKKFSLDFNLRTHLRIHSGEKPYACIFPGCFKRFSQSSNLSAHEKTHEIQKKNCNSIDESGQRPIFLQNPLSYLIDNPFSGTATMNNIIQINNLYEMMKKGINQQNSPNYNYSNYTQNNSQNNSGKHVVCFKTITENNDNNNNINHSVNSNSNNNIYNNIYHNDSNNNNINNINNNNNNIFNNNLNQGKKFVFSVSGKKVFDIVRMDEPTQISVNTNPNQASDSNLQIN